ncbi:MAG TPA: ferredoxin [Actinomycetales bacterium]|nr:ferredoxin [Actinomycetales bacterium]
MKIWVNGDCDGFARCVTLAPEVFTTPDEPDFRTTVIRPEVDEHGEEELAARVIAAIQQCPKRAIRTDLDVSF